jgi:hypothetical protein
LNRTRERPACSIVPQPTTLPRAPVVQHKGIKNDIKQLKGIYEKDEKGSVNISKEGKRDKENTQVPDRFYTKEQKGAENIFFATVTRIVMTAHTWV